MFRGLAFLWTNGTQVNAETLPDAFLNLGTDSIAGVPILVVFAVVVLLIVGRWLRDYRAGRELYAIGSNPDGARLAGVRSDRRVLIAFVLAGALAGLGGVLFTARFGTVDATAGAGYELTVDRGRRRRRRRDLRRHRKRLRRGPGRAAAGHHHVLADRPQGRGVLAAGRHRRAAADRHHRRPAPRAPRRGRPPQKERTPCQLKPPRPPPTRPTRPGRGRRAEPASAPPRAAGRPCCSG